MPDLDPKLSVGPNSVFFMDPDLTALDADALLSVAEDNERMAQAAEARRLLIAAAWADLHGVLDDPERCAALPGAERLVRWAATVRQRSLSLRQLSSARPSACHRRSRGARR